MTVKELCTSAGFKGLALPCPDRKISGCYIGDLLSWVMGRAKADNAWITIMSNSNVIAVASLTDVSCVIVSEGVELGEDIIALAMQKEVNILSSELNTYDCARMLFGYL